MINFSIPDFTQDFNSFKNSLKPTVPQYLLSLYESGIIESIYPVTAETTGITIAFKSMVPINTIDVTSIFKKESKLKTHRECLHNGTKHIVAYGYIIVDNKSLKVLHSTIYGGINIGEYIISYPQKLIPEDDISLSEIITPKYFSFISIRAMFSRYWYMVLRQPAILRKDNICFNHFFTLDSVSTSSHIKEIISIYNNRSR